MFCSKLKMIRESKRITKVELAEKSKISVNMIIKYENGQRDIDKASLDTLTKLATALDVKLIELLENDTLINRFSECI